MTSKRVNPVGINSNFASDGLYRSKNYEGGSRVGPPSQFVPDQMVSSIESKKKM